MRRCPCPKYNTQSLQESHFRFGNDCKIKINKKKLKLKKFSKSFHNKISK